jgi:hypothetical protein
MAQSNNFDLSNRAEPSSQPPPPPPSLPPSLPPSRTHRRPSVQHDLHPSLNPVGDAVRGVGQYVQTAPQGGSAHQGIVAFGDGGLSA